MSRLYNHIPRFDERSREFRILDIFAASLTRRSKMWRANKWLDQGQEGACTGFAAAHHGLADPSPRTGITAATARRLYARAKQLDEWPGENYDGSSVLAAVKAARELGWYKGFRWAFGEDDLAIAIGYGGPVILGIPWLAGMERPDKQGMIRATGPTRGGHAVLCVGYDAKLRLYRLHNSWGTRWGLSGDCWISADDMKKLLAMDGEACIPVKQ